MFEFGQALVQVAQLGAVLADGSFDLIRALDEQGDAALNLGEPLADDAAQAFEFQRGCRVGGYGHRPPREDGSASRGSGRAAFGAVI